MTFMLCCKSAVNEMQSISNDDFYIIDQSAIVVLTRGVSTCAHCSSVYQHHVAPAKITLM
jgi:hypothetical protein